MTVVSEGENICSDRRGDEIYLIDATATGQNFIAHARQDIPKLIAKINILKSIQCTNLTKSVKDTKRTSGLNTNLRALTKVAEKQENHIKEFVATLQLLERLKIKCT